MRRLQTMIAMLSAMALGLTVALVLLVKTPAKETEKPDSAASSGTTSGLRLKKDEGEDQTVHTDASTPDQKAPESPSPLQEGLKNSGATGSMERRLPLLVNADNPIPEDFKPDVTEIAGSEYQFDRSAVGKLNQMMAQAYSDGVILYPVSAYRSTESQTRNFNKKLEENKAAGYSDEEAYAMTAQYIAVPGTSEHSLGLAVDLNSLDESFENTAQFKWLIEHCAEYGFILRYPKDKEDITGIAYEPWHYRYVGEDHAAKIMEQGLCLEEYVKQAEWE